MICLLTCSYIKSAHVSAGPIQFRARRVAYGPTAGETAQIIKSHSHNSGIAPGDSKARPYKHRNLERYYWGGWANQRPYGKGIYFYWERNRKVYYEGEVDGLPNGIGKLVLDDGA